MQQKWGCFNLYLYLYIEIIYKYLSFFPLFLFDRPVVWCCSLQPIYRWWDVCASFYIFLPALFRISYILPQPSLNRRDILADSGGKELTILALGLHEDAAGVELF